MINKHWLKENIHIEFVLFAILHWAVTFFFEDRFFLAKSSYHSIAKLITLLLMWQIVAYIIVQYKQHHEYRVYLRFSLIYFILSFLLLLLIWPGNWTWDDLLVLTSCQINDMYIWHHFLTRSFFMAALYIFPDPISILILQIICISMIVGYFVYAISTILANKSKTIGLLYIAFLLPPVLVMNNTAFRSTLFSYLVLFFTIYILFNHWQSKPIRTTSIISLSLITSIIITLRGEGLVYFLMAPLLFVFAFWKITPYKQKTLYILLSFAFAFLISGIQNSLLGERESARYKLTLFIDPLGHLIETARKNNQTALLSEIDQILDIQYLTEMPANVAFFGTNLIRESYYEKNNQKKLSSLFIQLLKKYPKDFLDQRWHRFINSYSLQIAKNRIGSDNLEHAPAIYEGMFKNSYFSNYINSELRTWALSYLAPKKSTSFIHLITNLVIPFFVLLGITITALVKRKWVAMLAVLAIMCMYGPVFLGAPDSLFMYYFSFYLSAYAFACSIIFYLWQKDSKAKPTM